MSDPEELLDKTGTGMSTEKRKKLRKLGIIALVIVGMFGMFHLTDQKNKLPKAKIEARALDLGTGLLEDDIWEKFRNNKQNQSETNVALQDQINKAKSKNREMELLIKKILKSQKKLKATNQIISAESNNDNASYPDLSNKGLNNASFPPSPHYNPTLGAPNIEDNSAPAIEEWLGGLGSMPFKKFKAKSKKKQTLKFYQPPSFFEAKLLTGIDAMTSKNAKSDPEQVFLMITAPAVLPNHIKQNLKGCFVVANASGNLAKERVQLQVVNLSCVSADGSAVIDQEVLGFVADKDGKRDLAGHVVAKNATKMALLMVASAVGAIGDSITLNSIQQDQTALGTSTVVDLSKIGSRIGGAAIKETSQDYKDIIIEYIRQSGPVIEVGAMKEATVFIQKGVWLKIIDRFNYDKGNSNE
ncbi:MAG: hypothetical protein HRT38_04125 [Alteromonadaceae bacterium]|nr:hypothetical protein [Alteromonadaceae bacterium]